MMRSDLVILPEPGIDCDQRLLGVAKPLSIEHFSSECFVEAFVISVSPWAAWID